MEIAYVAILFGGATIVVYGFVGRGPFYNSADMAMSKEEREDRRPATKLERLGYIVFGLVIFVYALLHVF